MAPSARRYLLLLAATAVSFSYSAPTWAAADDTLGMAIMSASVTSNGTLHHGSGVVSVAKQAGNGSYYVTFERSIANCTCAANLGGVDGNTDYSITWFVNANCPGFGFGGPVDPTVAHVYTSRSASSFMQADAAFHLVVFCPR